MKTYTVKEIYYTLQGEGGQSGRAAVFCRFAGCNLWSGREEDRENAICQFCDTDFFGTDGENGGKYSGQDLANRIASLWPQDSGRHLVVCTGGEPLLQLDSPLVAHLHKLGFEIAIESNGTIKAPPGIDWICISPKAHTQLEQTSGDEIKVVYPQPGIDPSDFVNLDFRHYFLQPMDGPFLKDNIEKSIQYCLQNPQWRLSLQTHKLVGLK